MKLFHTLILVLLWLYLLVYGFFSMVTATTLAMVNSVIYVWRR